MLTLLDEILLSDNVVESFYKHYQNEEFKNWILSILPEIEDCQNTEQDNPWHIYNCLDHILHSVEEMNKQTKAFDSNIRRMLAYTMFLHDIGKPECKLRRYAKLYKREVDSFFHHNLASVKIGERVLDKLGFNQEESIIILKLVKEHDLFMNLTLEDATNPYKRKLTQEVLDELVDGLDTDNGKKLMKYLLLVGKADNLAQNPKMTGQSLELLDIMTNMLDVNENNITKK